MIDAYVLLTPILMLAVIALVRFIGCGDLFGLRHLPDIDSPTGLQAVPGVGTIALTWDPYPSAREFTVKRGTISGQYPDAHTITPPSNAYTDFVDSGVMFFYVVTATTSEGESGPSNEESAMATAPLTSFVRHVTPVNPRNNFPGSGWVGMAIRVGTSPLVIRALGRYCISGNTRAHDIKIFDVAASQDLQDGLVTVNMAGAAAGTFVYALLPAPVPLAAGAVYYIVSSELDSGDEFYDFLTTIETETVAAETGAIFGPPSAPPYTPSGVAGQTYGPVNFLY